MSLTLDADDFALFDLPRQFAQDSAAIDQRWKALQREVHPDRFAVQGGAAQRLAMQWSVRINEAWQRLKDPVRRAAYLCQLQGVAIDAERNTAMPAAFLMQQMQWRETLDEASDAAAVEALADEVVAARRAALARCEQLADVQHDWAALAQEVRALMFVERFAADVEARLDALGQ